MIIWNIFYSLVDLCDMIVSMWLVIVDMCIYVLLFCGELFSFTIMDWMSDILVHGGLCTITTLFSFLVEFSKLSND